MKNALLLLCSLLLTYLCLEFAVFQVGLRFLPLRLHGYLDTGIQALAQSSKRGTIPRDYVLIVGDSYAKGYGDWLFATGSAGNPAFHSAHVIHDNSGRDVIDFGRSGAGSLLGIAEEPIARFHFLQRSLRFAIERPRQVLVYFYEGNDLDNNLLRMQRLKRDGVLPETVSDPARFRAKIESLVRRHSVYRDAEGLGVTGRLFGARFVMRVVTERLPTLPVKRWIDGAVNRVNVNGRIVAIPDELQSPAMELNPHEIDRAVYVFEQTLAVLRAFFSDSVFALVYLPSPLSAYEIASPTVSIESYHGRASVYPSEGVTRSSDAICARLEAVARRNAMAFIDARAAIRSVSTRTLVHGPRDWRHFNRHGYTALGEATAAFVTDGKTMPCAPGEA